MLDKKSFTSANVKYLHFSLSREGLFAHVCHTTSHKSRGDMG